MSFFKKYNGTMNTGLARLEKLVWTLIYGGVLSGLIGLFMQRGGDEEGQWLMWGGGAAVLLGFILIIVRSRLKEGPDAGAHGRKPDKQSRGSS